MIVWLDSVEISVLHGRSPHCVSTISGDDREHKESRCVAENCKGGRQYDVRHNAKMPLRISQLRKENAWMAENSRHAVLRAAREYKVSYKRL